MFKITEKVVIAQCLEMLGFSIVDSEKIEIFLIFIIYLLCNYFGVLVGMGEGFMSYVVKLVKIQ